MNSTALTLEGLIHDLNNVFQTMAEGAELLSSDPAWAKLAAALQRSIERGQRIANSIVEQKRSSAELDAVLDNAVQFVGDYLEAVHGPAVTFQRQVEPAFQVPGDPAAWERVFVNLFLNSAEAGGKAIRISAAADEITIRDDGPGVEPTLLPTIFQPHVSTKPILSGLGLYVVRSIVEANGALVTAANAEDGGAVFQIKLSGVAAP
jgi:two-component system sensor histidine kinase MprB